MIKEEERIKSRDGLPDESSNLVSLLGLVSLSKCVSLHCCVRVIDWTMDRQVEVLIMSDAIADMRHAVRGLTGSKAFVMR